MRRKGRVGSSLGMMERMKTNSIVLNADIHGCIQRSIGPDQHDFGNQAKSFANGKLEDG